MSALENSAGANLRFSLGVDSVGNSSITVVIPNYNRTDLLRKTLRSLERQTLRPHEVIIVDDCSQSSVTTEIKLIVAGFRDTLNIRLLVNSTNKGANYSRNRGIAFASTKYIAFLDSDDLWMPKKLEIQMASIADAESTDKRPILSATGRYRVDGNGQIIACHFGGLSFNSDRIRRSNFLGTLSSVVVDAGVAREIGGFDETLGASQDWDFFIRLANRVQYVGVRQPLCVYVDHSEDRITSNSTARVIANARLRRTYLRNLDLSSRDKSSIYVVIAEDLQNLGKSDKADLYYAFHRYRRSWRIATVLFPRRLLLWLYILLGTPDLRRLRYNRYVSALSKIKKEPSGKVQIDSDQRLITSLVRS